MLLLDNPIQTYAWGRRNGIAEAVGTAPTGGPEAELWVGTHPSAPSTVAEGPDAGRSLGEVIGFELPFLLKVLAIAEPLSLQAHPSASQAAAGFAREEAEGVAIDAPERTYRDANAKPEALVALTETHAMCGFRTPDDVLALVASAASPALDGLAAALKAESLAGGLRWMLDLTGDERADVASAAVRASLGHGGSPSSPWYWVADLATHHPGDPGCLAPLLLEVVRLEPGAAVHLSAGNLHAYLRGSGVEIMAASDNVLRGGLTPKHVDIPELLRIVRFEPGVPPAPVRREVDGVTRYDAGEAAFALACVAAGPPATTVSLLEPAVLLAPGGDLRVDQGDVWVEAAPGQAIYAEPGAALRITSAVDTWVGTSGTGLDG